MQNRPTASAVTPELLTDTELFLATLFWFLHNLQALNMFSSMFISFIYFPSFKLIFISSLFDYNLAQILIYIIISIILSLNVLFYFSVLDTYFSCHNVEHFLMSKLFNELNVQFFFKFFICLKWVFSITQLKPLKFYVHIITCSLIC